MPYRPGVQFDPSPLYAGPASFGKSILAASDARADEQLRREQMQMQAEVAGIEMEDRGTQRGLDRTERARLALQEDERRVRMSVPQPVPNADKLGMPGALFVPLTGQVVQPKGAGSEPYEGARPKLDANGQIIGHTFWVNGKEQFVKKGQSAEELMASILGPGAGGRTGTTTTPGAPAGAAATAGSGALPVAKTKAERDALPPGSSYIGPDGQRYRKK